MRVCMNNASQFTLTHTMTHTMTREVVKGQFIPSWIFSPKYINLQFISEGLKYRKIDPLNGHAWTRFWFLKISQMTDMLNITTKKKILNDETVYLRHI